MRAGLSLLTAATLLACAPTMNSKLLDAEAEYRSAAADPMVTSRAEVPLYEAKKSLDRAKSAYENDEDEVVVDHLSYVASRRVEIARATAQKETAKERVETLGEARDAVVLDARTQEAEIAKQRAATAEITADALAAELEALKAEETERGLVITLDDVLFEVDRADLKAGAMADLQRLADALNTDPERNVLIEGHTDSTGPADYNVNLSQRRADAVRSALLRDGVSAERIETRGFGAAMPVASNSTASGRQQNRRVEIVVLDPRS